MKIKIVNILAVAAGIPIAALCAASASAWAAVGGQRARAAPSDRALGTTAGEFHVEPPTLESLGFEWRIAGDANRDARVEITYRKRGEAAWRQGLPLLRLDGEETISSFFKGAFTYVAPNMFSGSLFNLEPGVAYDVRLTLSDPDGVRGKRHQQLVVRTRPEPMPASGGHIFNVYPFGYTGPKQEPAFSGLLGAYYQGSVGGDWYNAFAPRVQPGDVILVHAGVYKDDRFRYGHELMSGYRQCCNTTGDGTYYLTAKGTPQKPIVIKTAGDGEVIFDGDGNYNLFNVMAANYNYFEGLTFRNTQIVFEAGLKRIAGTTGLTIKHSRFYDIGVGVHTDYAGSKDFYIADNEFVGRHNPSLFMGWSGRWAKVAGFVDNSRLLSQFAVKVYGSGHVIAYNRVRNFHDGIDHATYGDPEGYPNTPHALKPSSIDIYNNDISNVHDNCIEADGAMHNIRVMRNLCVNAGSHAYSLQPLLGGPAYFIRNALYNSPYDGAIKFSEFPAGGVFLNNTWLSNFAPGETAVGSNMLVRNNIFIGQNPDAPVFQMTTATSYSSSDHNGFGPGFFQWNSPALGNQTPAGQPLVNRSFPSLVAYVAATAQDQHSVSVDFSDFEHVAPVDPSVSVTTLYDGATLDLRLTPSSRAIDRGIVLPNVTDDYSGVAPDLGVIERGQPLPHYGPRP